MPSGKNPPTKPAASIATAAQRTQSVIQDLQAKLTEASQHGGVSVPPLSAMEAVNPVVASSEPETEADLESQLAAYFAQACCQAGVTDGSILEDLRKRVIDGVVQRIVEDWSKPGSPSAIRDEVLERLIERVLQQFGTSKPALRDSLPN